MPNISITWLELSTERQTEETEKLAQMVKSTAVLLPPNNIKLIYMDTFWTNYINKHLEWTKHPYGSMFDENLIFTFSDFCLMQSNCLAMTIIAAVFIFGGLPYKITIYFWPLNMSQGLIKEVNTVLLYCLKWKLLKDKVIY